ncbi:PAS domain-containing sensor histidine kinase [Clostridium oryzae]|uniref:histidine kinase n=1 Tax=Clostridium oryzae TaxID=1450648 RepID=A0A1V4IMM6_9CLOT|nr:PAS domain-containing sensor histidine kinase [Clostridium oryzae]OPJ61094.1 sensor histidine kinase TmoS [Clostridium oryzae]
MSGLGKNDEVKMNKVVVIINIMSLLFCTLIIYNNLSRYNNKLFHSIIMYLTVHPVFDLIIFIAFMYLVCKVIHIINYKLDRNCILIAGNIMFILMVSLSIIFSKTYVYEYKLLFIFVIISTTLQFGMEKGIIIALVSSIITFTADFLFFLIKGPRVIIQDDIILFGMFMLTAWSIGVYVKTREENIRQKSLKLNELNYELAHENSERKYIEKVFEKNEKCYALIIENSRDAIFIHMKDKIVFINDSALKLLELTAEQVKGREIEDFICQEEKKEFIDIINKVVEEKQTNIKFQGSLINKSGRLIAVESISNYIAYNNNAAIITIVHDISYEKEIEQLKINVKKDFELLNKTIKLNNSITQLFVNMSHELKTPLNVIFSALQVLIMNSKNSSSEEHKKMEYFYTMKQNCYRLMKLINNFFMLTKLDAGMIKTKFKNQDIVSRIEDITTCVAEYNKKRNIKITFDTAIEEKVIAFDSEMISKVMLNLLSNAVKYCDKDGEILVSIWSEEDVVYISVKDNGIGIPEDKIKFVFERFSQADKTLAREFEGTGVGLSIVKALIELHKGSISIDSCVGEGSEFIIMLPDKKVEMLGNEDNGNNVFETDMERIYIEFSDIY